MNASDTMVSKVDNYLAYRRHAGFSLDREGGQLSNFARFADESGHCGPLTLELSLSWAMLPTTTQSSSQLTAARRIEVLRGFARYYQQFEPESIVPPMRLFGHAHRRKVPHIFTDTEIGELLKATEQLQPIGGLRAASSRAVFSLLIASGMRISEVTGLERSQVDLTAGVITVSGAKFGKSRFVPLHPTAVSALQNYVIARDADPATARTSRFFVGDYGREITTQSVQYIFKRIRKQLGWRSRGEYLVPRIHDMRHTFICRTIQRWYDNGENIDQHILALSTYVGRVKVTDTYWYITATPELMASAARRFQCPRLRGVLE